MRGRAIALGALLALVGGCDLFGDEPAPHERDQDGDGWRPLDGDCDDADAAVNPAATEIPDDGVDNDCDGEDLHVPVDGDGDGVPEGEDCDDDDFLNSPARDEWCDGQDNDCDGDIDEGADADADGHTTCGPDGDEDTPDDDCDDTLADVFPGATETGDARDEDCDGDIDEDFDADGDGYSTCGPDGLPGSGDEDCDDSDPEVRPGIFDDCDGVDTNCNGVVDEDGEGGDQDGDGYGSCDGDEADCHDGDPTIHPGAPEFCNGWDDNCDGTIDEGFDADGDGHSTCEVGCDDVDPEIYEGAADLPGDGIDQDCDGADQVSDCIGPPMSLTETEPNDYGGQTNLVTAGAARRLTLAGTLQCDSDDEDWFALNITCGGPFTATATWTGNPAVGFSIDQGATNLAGTGAGSSPRQDSGEATEDHLVARVFCGSGGVAPWSLEIDWD